MRARASGTLEHAREVELAEAGDGREITDRQRRPEVRLDEIGDPPPHGRSQTAAHDPAPRVDRAVVTDEMGEDQVTGVRQGQPVRRRAPVLGDECQADRLLEQRVRRKTAAPAARGRRDRGRGPSPRCAQGARSARTGETDRPRPPPASRSSVPPASGRASRRPGWRSRRPAGGAGSLRRPRHRG